MAKKVILSQDGETIYPATILGAIIDPNTGNPVNISQGGGSSSETVYTINGTYADESGNFTLTNTMLGAAAENHQHAISDIQDLQSQLNGKSDKGHGHDVVTGIQVNDDTLIGNVKIQGKGNITVSKNRNSVNITVSPFIADIAKEIEDSADNQKKFEVFIGTENEYELFKSTMENGKRYLVFIRS